jgi:hypothetical protein
MLMPCNTGHIKWKGCYALVCEFFKAIFAILIALLKSGFKYLMYTIPGALNQPTL